MTRIVVICFLIFTNIIIADDALATLKQRAPILFSSFSGNYSLTGASGRSESGKIQYEYPGKMYLQKSDGSIVATNGHFLWLFRAKSYICIRQDVGGLSGGLLPTLSKYSGQIQGNNFIFTNEALPIKQIIVLVEGKIVKNIRFLREDSQYTVSFSNLSVGGVKASLYNFKPPVSAQLIINPLNN